MRRCVLGHSLICVVIYLGATAPNAPAGEAATYESNWAAFVSEMDGHYPFFELKGIKDDWAKFKEQAAPKAKACASDAAFLNLVREAIYCLRDSHMGISNTKAKIPPPEPEYYPGVSFMRATQDRVVVMGADQSGPKPGTVVVEIDGKPARAFLEERAKEAWAAGGPFSSTQRARLFEYRIPFRGKKGEKHSLTLLTAAGKQTATLVSTTEAHGWPHTYNMPPQLTRNGTCSFAQLPSGCGYIYLRQVDGTTAAGIGAALTAHKTAKGWIVDLRGNGGGGYSEDLIEQLRAIPKPVAVLIDAGCISAGETLARDLTRICGARLFGEATAGASSAKRQWSFPSGLATLMLSVRGRAGTDGKTIEFNGVTPDETVEAVPEEVQAGKNSTVLRAEEFLSKQR